MRTRCHAMRTRRHAMRRAAQAMTAGLHPVNPATLIMYFTASVGVYWTPVAEHGVEAAQQLAHAGGAGHDPGAIGARGAVGVAQSRQPFHVMKDLTNDVAKELDDPEKRLAPQRNQRS